MSKTVLDSIIEITNNRDSDEFGISIVATIAELIPSCSVCLFQYNEFPFASYKSIVTLSVKKDDEGIKQFQWNIDVPQDTHEYLDKNIDHLLKLTVYQSSQGVHHVFIPILIEGKIEYAIDISSEERFSNKLDSILAITKVCENFYAILAHSEKDSLTGLFNRRTYDLKLNQLIKKQYYNKKYGESIENEKREKGKAGATWLAVIDIDLFKQVNDKFGHIYGDEVLLTLSQLMNHSFRQNDLLFRFGGEEFVIILEPISDNDVVKLLESFRAKVSQHKFPMVGKITVSIGFAKVADSVHPKSIFDNADKALYYAKEAGRNKVCNYEQLVASGDIFEHEEEGDIELF